MGQIPVHQPDEALSMQAGHLLRLVQWPAPLNAGCSLLSPTLDPQVPPKFIDGQLIFAIHCSVT
jgi:hypothetical protein